MPFDVLFQLLRAPVLAQSSGSTSDFLSQIGSLLIVTCAAGVVWVITMALVLQRASERRRRAKMGLDPLPAIHIVAYRRLMALLAPDGTAPQTAPQAAKSSSARREAMPAPDLTMLLDDLPEPDLGAMLGGDAESPPDEWFEPEPPRPAAPPLKAAPVNAGPLPGRVPAASDPDSGAGPVPEPLSASVDFGGDMSVETERAMGSEPADAVELLRVWRDLSDGGLIVEIAGRRFRSLNELRSADLERRFVNVVRDLYALARNPSPAPTPSAARSAPFQARKPAAPDEPEPKEEPPARPASTELPSMRPGAMLRQMTRAAMGQAPEPLDLPPVLSIADQIELLLQNRLAEHPDFEGREIHVRPSLHGTVRIEIDGTSFDGVGEVQDQAVRDLLSDVVREWEASQ